MAGLGSLTPAATALGLAPGAGNQLVQQRQDELEEQKRKKMLGAGSASPAVAQLFGMQGMPGLRGATL